MECLLGRRFVYKNTQVRIQNICTTQRLAAHLKPFIARGYLRRKFDLPPNLPRFCDQFLPKSTDSKFNAFSSGGFEKPPGLIKIWLP